MSVKKSAAFISTLGKFIASKRALVSNEIKRTARHHAAAGRDPGISLHRFLLSPFTSKKVDAFGAKTVERGLKHMERGFSKVDTGLGALARGNAQPGSWRYGMFTDKAKFKVHGTPDMYREMTRASISKPLKSVAPPVTAALALSKWEDISQKFGGPKKPPGNNPEGGAEY